MADRSGEARALLTFEQRSVVDIVHEEFGTPISTTIPEAWGPRVIVGAELEDAVVFVKAAGDSDVVAEAATIELARAAGVPVPEVVASGADGRLPGGDWIALAKVPGVNWDISGSATNARTVGDLAVICGQLSRVRVAGFGALTADSVGRLATWRDWVLGELEDYLGQLLEADYATEEFAARARAVFTAHTPVIAQGSLVHGDLAGSHTFVDPTDGSVTGVIDWGDSLIGDPVYELAKFIAGGPPDDPWPERLLPEIVEHYLVETDVDRDRLNRTLPLYRAHNAIFNAAWSVREGTTSWIDGLLSKADELLDQWPEVSITVVP